MIDQNDIKKLPVQVSSALDYLKIYLDKKNSNDFEIVLYGSQVTSINTNKDFDIGFRSQKKNLTFKEFALLKQKIEDIAFPYRIDLKNLNTAPSWFIESALSNYIYLYPLSGNAE